MSSGQPILPPARGPLTTSLFAHLRRDPHEVPPLPPSGEDPLTGDDFQLALYCCYELHYQGFADVAEEWEWEPSLLAARRRLERHFERRLVEEVGPVGTVVDAELALRETIEGFSGPSLSRHMADHGTLDQFREFAVHRSAYQLKEADPHTWAIPRLRGAAKASLIEIQLDEYGSGVEQDMHASLFGTTMDLLGLDSTYGAYLHALPGCTLATTNLISMFGLHRRWRGALAGHLAVFETTSVGPMSRYAEALRRLGVDRHSERFYDVHVAIDGHHEVVACKGLVGGLAAAEPALAEDIVFGARALMAVEDRFARTLLEVWATGGSALLVPLARDAPCAAVPDPCP
jgi:hypothetical protein